MLPNQDDFLNSLCVWAQNELTDGPSAGPVVYILGGNSAVNLIRNEAVEGSVLFDPYAVIRFEGGEGSSTNPVISSQIRLSAYGSSNDDTSALAQIIHQTIALDAGGMELQGVVVPAFKAADQSSDGQWKIVFAKTTRRPSLIGRDARNRANFVSNYLFQYFKVQN